ncbi:hypothetical protein [Streptomyces venezuelae]
MRAFYRGYSAATGRRAKQVRRLHVVREDGKFAGRQGLCGTPGWGVTKSPAVILEPLPAEPPAGLAWCNACLGHAAHLVGQTEAVARAIADLAEATCGRCKQTRKLFSFSWVPDGWMEFKEIHLCARCHSLSALEDEDGRLDSNPLLEHIGALS